MLGTVQIGRANSSNLNVEGDRTQIGVLQTGLNRQSNLTVVDRQGGLSLSVVQGPRDPQLNARIERSIDGTITIQPGTATTVLRLSGS